MYIFITVQSMSLLVIVGENTHSLETQHNVTFMICHPVSGHIEIIWESIGRVSSYNRDVRLYYKQDEGSETLFKAYLTNYCVYCS